MNKITFVENYLNRGWGLTPVGAPKSGNKDSGKNPFLPEWTRNPVRDMEAARSHWDNDKGYNVGVMTGEVSGLIVLDIDVPDVFDKFLEQFPECRNTYIVRRNNAPDWKCHYYFKLDGFTPPSHTVKTTGWGDLMSNGRQVVAPPSVHYTGGVYEVVNDVEPLPFKKEYLANLLLVPPKGKKKVAKEKAVFESGTPEGERNTRLFQRMRQMRNRGCGQKEAEVAALEFCQACNPPYDESEAMRTVESVYADYTPVKNKETLSQLNYRRESILNERGETEYKLKPLDYHLALERFKELLQGKVANVNGELVVLPSKPDEKSFPLKNSTDVFSYLGTFFQGVPDWMKGKGYMSKEELFSALAISLPDLESVELIPHYPQLKTCHYVLPELAASDMGILNEFLDFFAPETPYDRDLILALFLTVLWGGPAGQRAPFLVTSKDGRGVGKSTLAETAAKLLNQVPIQASTRLDSDSLTTRLLSWDGRKSRIVLFDNEVGTMQKISNAGMAALFTTGRISGKELYKGEGSRPNYLIWIMTLNSVTFDSDFASRCIPIALKRPAKVVNWQEELNLFIEKHRWTLISTLLELLKFNTKDALPMTRWGLWENRVLAKVPGIDREKVLELVISRQKNNDNDLDEKEMMIDALQNLINATKKERIVNRFFICNSDMANLVRDALHLKQGNAWILSQVKDIIAKGDYPALKIHKTKCGRGFIWDETTDEKTSIVTLLWEGKTS